MFEGFKITKLHLTGEGESKCESFSVLFQRITSSCNGMAQWYLSCYRDCYKYFVKINNYCTVYYCSLIYEPCLHKHARFFVSPATSRKLSASLKISLSHQAVYQYLLDNLVSGPSFVPTVIAALHPSNILHIRRYLRDLDQFTHAHILIYTLHTITYLLCAWSSIFFQKVATYS